MFLLLSCSLSLGQPAKSQEDILHDMEINNPGDFAALDPCKQIKIYTEVGYQFLSLDHNKVIVPTWMDSEIAKQPKETVMDCIIIQGENLLNQLSSTYTFENEKRSLKIHALIYKANDLHIIGYDGMQQFVLSAMCNKNLYYRESISIIYYASTETDYQNFPDPGEILRDYCINRK